MLVGAAFATIAAGLSGRGTSTGRVDTLFDSGWRFQRGRCEPALAAAAPGLDDTGWRSLDLPRKNQATMPAGS